MDDEQRDSSVIRTLEGAHADMLDEVREQGDRRHDALLQWQARTDRRYWVVAVLLTFAIISTIASVVVGAWILAHQQDRLGSLVRQQQAGRRRAVVDACYERNRLAGGILFFISHVAPHLERQAAHVFRTQPSCAEYTAAVLANDPPPPTAAGLPLPPVP